MTYAVMIQENDSLQRIGTIWTSGDSEAQTLAASLSQAGNRPIIVRRTEQTELPLKLEQ